MIVSAFAVPPLVSTLLATEGLLLSAIALAVGLSSVRQRAQRFDINPRWVAFGALFVLFVVGAGALVGCVSAMNTQPPEGWEEGAMVAALLVAIASQPFLALLLTLTLLPED